MSVSENVMPSPMWSHSPRHYEAFSMDIDLLIPLKTQHQDYLNHPLCDAAKVAELVQCGESLAGMSRILGVSTHIVGQVLQALEMRPNRRLRPATDLLHHPKIDIDVLRSLRKQQKTVVQIANILHVSKKAVSRTMTAMADHGEERERLQPRARPDFPTRLNYADHPIAKPDTLRQLIAEGLSLAAIAVRLGVSTRTLRKVIAAVQADDPTLPFPVATNYKRVYPHIDYLQHPKCPVSEVRRLQESGYTQKRMAAELKVSIGTIQNVLHVMKVSSPRA